jgi:putative DNA primase/helicase
MSVPLPRLDFAPLIGPVARRLLGEPNVAMSSRNELRFGTRGSLAVKIAGDNRGTWFDHEANEGGGVIDLVRRELHLVNGEALEWLRREAGAEVEAPLDPTSTRAAAPHAPAQNRAQLGRIVATYDYRDANGALVFQVIRHDPKDFRQRQPDGTGGWTWNVKGVDLVPYRLPELLAAPADAPVFIPEGEKDVDALRALGLVATCNPGGAGKWRREYGVWFQGRAVVVLPDNDPQATDATGALRWHSDGRPILPGQDHADDVARRLQGIAATVRVVMLPGLPSKGDVADWIAAGGTLEELESLAAAAPEAQRPPPKMDSAIANAAEVELTEDGAAIAFTQRHRDQLRYCHDTGAWFAWAGTHWRQNRDGLAFTWARDLVRSLNRDTEFKTKAITGKAAFAGAVEKFAQRDRAFAVTAEAWDQDPHLLGTPGGTVDLRTGLLRPAERANHITRVTAVAPAPTAHCPTWLAFLQQATAGDAELIRFLQQWCGYCLTGVTREHALLFIYGPGKNGKSVLLNTVSRILAAYCRSAPMDTFTSSSGDKHPTDLAMLRGARLVTATETEEGRAWAEARIKQMTGGDPVTARFMRQDFFTYTPQFKLTIAGNHKPALKNVDDAARRRFNIVPFLHTPPQPDKHLEEKLQREWPGILRWMIDGCLDWQRAGLVRPKVVADATAEYFEAQVYRPRMLRHRAAAYAASAADES